MCEGAGESPAITNALRRIQHGASNDPVQNVSYALNLLAYRRILTGDCEFGSPKCSDR